MATENYLPKTVREQIFYIIGNLNGMERDEDGFVKVHHDTLMEQLAIVANLDYENKIPQVGWREAMPQKATCNEPVTSISYRGIDTGTVS